MYLPYISLIPLLATVALIATSIASWFQPGLRPRLVKSMAVTSILISILSAAVSGFFLSRYGLLESPFAGINDLGFSLRLDPLSLVMFSMISVIGFVVVKFSLNYLDGDANQGRFIGRLAATITSVQLLVLSGNLGLLLISWMMTSISLHRLLVFYSDRPAAIVAARKKFIVARLADACLLGSVLILYRQFGTGNLEIIFTKIKPMLASGEIPASLEFAALFLAFAALLKSAQFPSHGWLIDVMETPTPVSALLHAGLLNAGPFLLIRMAYVVEASTYAPLLIIALGGFTALFASAAFLTQTSIKTALGYSSVAHMGFSLFVCAAGAYPVAMLHLVAHSFYKAHAFLSSGSVIDVMRASKIKQVKRTGSGIKIMTGIAIAIILFTAIALALGVDPTNDLALLLIGGVIVMGLSTLFTSALDTPGINGVLLLRTSLLAGIVTVSFFTLEAGAKYLLTSQVPALSKINAVEIIFMGVFLLAFATVTFIQIQAPALASKPYYRSLSIHLKNGFYANALFDRMIGSLHIHNTRSTPSEHGQPESNVHTGALKIKTFEEQIA